MYTTQRVKAQSEEPCFNDAWERYEHLRKQSTLTDSEKSWINDYETGAIFPGEWQSNYGQKRVQEGQE